MSVVAAKIYSDRVTGCGFYYDKRMSKQANNNFVKINKINDMIVGGCGLSQEISLIWHYMATHKPASATEKAILDFIVEFSKWKRELTGESTVQNTYLIIFEGHLFEIEHMFVFEIKDHIAIGAGEDYANAALHLGHSPKEAVEVACDLCCYVCSPIIEYSAYSGECSPFA